MRTPGHDFELTAGFLFAEDIISSAAQIRGMAHFRPNVVEVELSPDAVLRLPPSQRALVMTLACGVCGKDSLESLAANRCPVLPPSRLKIDAGVIHRLPYQLRQWRASFELVQKVSMAGVPVLAAVGALRAWRLRRPNAAG